MTNSATSDGIDQQMPWLTLYPQGQPKTIKAEFDTLPTAFHAHMHTRSDTPIVHYFDTHMLFDELDTASSALATVLRERGFVQGDRLAIYTQNNPAFVIGLLATWKAGGIAVPINPMNKACELDYLLDNSGARALLCLDTLYVDVAQEVLKNRSTQVTTVIICSALNGQSCNDSRVLDIRPRQTPPAGVLDLQHIVKQDSDMGGWPYYFPNADDLALLAYTSGTTGYPKGAMLTHGNLAFSAQTYRDWFGLNAHDTILGLAPLFHITGIVSHIGLMLLTGAPLILTHRFQPEVMLDAILQYRPTFTIGAITAFLALMNIPQTTREHFSSFRVICSGGAPIPAAVIAQFEALSGHYLYNVFGMTETTSPTHMVPLGTRAPVDPVSGALSVGVPVFNTATRIVDESGQDVAVGAIGEVVDAGPQVMRGYWNMPEATAASIPDGWLRTGDVGFMDAQGWFYLVDRKKDMINASGYKVWPREVEDMLYRHPAVREVAVVGVADEYRGETVKAAVSFKPGMSVDADVLLAWCKTNMAAYKCPRVLLVMDELPKTATGKILRRLLR